MTELYLIDLQVCQQPMTVHVPPYIWTHFNDCSVHSAQTASRLRKMPCRLVET